MKKLLLVLFAFIAIVSCKKDINGDFKNRRQILTSKSWRIVSVKDNGTRTAIKECERDNYYVFSEDGSGRIEEGLNNCLDTVSNNNNPIPGDSTFNQEPVVVPTNTPFRWTMIANLTFIYFGHINGQEYGPEWQITNMDYNSLSVQYSEDVDGRNHRYEVELIAL